MYISSKITDKLTAQYNNTINNRIDGDKEYKVDCFIDDYLFPLLTDSYNENIIFDSILKLDIELYRDGGCDLDRLKWYIKGIKRNLMKLDDITLTFLINACILIEENK